jgi:hypothetical protein
LFEPEKLPAGRPPFLTVVFCWAQSFRLHRLVKSSSVIDFMVNLGLRDLARFGEIG